MKRCPHCKAFKESSEFYSSKTSKDGLDCWCSFCRKEHRKRYRESNRLYMRKYAKEHPEKMVAWRKNNAEHIREYERLLYAKNPAKNLSYTKNRKLRLKGTLGVHTEDEWQDIISACNNRCFGCGKENIKLTKDHIIPVSRGGSNDITNILPLCQSCNSKKGTQDDSWYMKTWISQELLKSAFIKEEE